MLERRRVLYGTTKRIDLTVFLPCFLWHALKLATHYLSLSRASRGEFIHGLPSSTYTLERTYEESFYRVSNPYINLVCKLAQRFSFK